MYKLIITNASSGILLWAGVGSNEESLKTYGENWADENGLLKTNVSYKATCLRIKQQTPFPVDLMVPYNEPELKYTENEEIYAF